MIAIALCRSYSKKVDTDKSTGYDISTSLTVVTDYLISNGDKCLENVMILFDFSKAFDTLNH